jgi:hypothetical protein
VTESHQASVLLQPGESTEPAAGHVLEKDTLHGVLAAVREDPVAVWLDEVCHPPHPASSSWYPVNPTIVAARG